MGSQELGEKVGFFGMFLVATVILYLVLSFLGNLPRGWGYFDVFSLFLMIFLIGILIRKTLK